MREEVRVGVVAFGDRRHYQLQWRDPVSGKLKTRSSKILNTGRQKDRQAAERKAADLEKELEAGALSGSKLSWESFRDRYESEVLESLAPGTAERVRAIFNRLEEVVNPKHLRELTSERLSGYQAELRNKNFAEPTIKSHLSHIKAALNWAVRMGMLQKAPKIDMPKRTATMKGRPITTEEFERMLEKVVDGLIATTRQRGRKAEPIAERSATGQARAVRAQAVAGSWVHYLRGLFLSGLRVAESLTLAWGEHRGAGLWVNLEGRRPMLFIPAHIDKGGKDRLLPITPDFAAFLLETPESERRGFVFNPQRMGRGGRINRSEACRAVSAIGEKANVKVNQSKSGRVKYASAHDLRRSFGERWSQILMPQALMELMRHETISTTLRFYIGRNAERTADAVWRAVAERDANSRANREQNQPASGTTENDAMHD